MGNHDYINHDVGIMFCFNFPTTYNSFEQVALLQLLRGSLHLSWWHWTKLIRIPFLVILCELFGIHFQRVSDLHFAILVFRGVFVCFLCYHFGIMFFFGARNPTKLAGHFSTTSRIPLTIHCMFSRLQRGPLAVISRAIIPLQRGHNTSYPFTGMRPFIGNV